MKSYIIVAISVLVGVGVVWFLMSGDSTSNESQIITTNDQGLDLQGAPTPTVTADPVATVNGEEISNADFTTQLTQTLAVQGVNAATLDGETLTMIQGQILDSLISQELLKQAALASGVEVADAEIDNEINSIKGQFEDEATYEQALAGQGLTENELRAQVAVNLSVEPYLEQTLDLASITATQEEIDQAYQAVAAQQEVPPLEEVRTQVEQLVVQQKRQPLIDQHLASLREAADIEVFI